MEIRGPINEHDPKSWFELAEQSLRLADLMSKRGYSNKGAPGVYRLAEGVQQLLLGFIIAKMLPITNSTDIESLLKTLAKSDERFLNFISLAKNLNSLKGEYDKLRPDVDRLVGLITDLS